MLVDAVAASPVLGFFGGRNGTPGKGTHCGREPVTVDALPAKVEAAEAWFKDKPAVA